MTRRRYERAVCAIFRVAAEPSMGGRGADNGERFAVAAGQPRAPIPACHLSMPMSTVMG